MQAGQSGELGKEFAIPRSPVRSTDPGWKEPDIVRVVATVDNTQITTNLPAVSGADVQRVRAAGWDDEAIYFAITSCALFNFYNRWITATGVPQMSDEAHREQGRALAARGYIRD